MSERRKFEERKRRELSLVSDGAGIWRGSPARQLGEKMRGAAKQKAHFILEHPDVTETNLSNKTTRAGDFELDYSYQRADITVSASGFYDPLPEMRGTMYTISGMSALAAALMAFRDLGAIQLHYPPGSYAETSELAALLGLKVSAAPSPKGDEIVLADSAGPEAPTDESLAAARFVLFDTSCYAASSGHIRRIAAKTNGACTLLVRSHTKLDTLGTEYGRLGSVTLLAPQETPATSRIAKRLSDAIRLLGVAPIPMHFPPFSDESLFRQLSRDRVAQIIRNTRILRAQLARMGIASKRYHHGLYTTVETKYAKTPDSVRLVAARLTKHLAARGLPVRHAGSFGFDFVGLEWFTDSAKASTQLRLAAGDIEHSAMNEVASELAQLLRSETHEQAPMQRLSLVRGTEAATPR